MTFFCVLFGRGMSRERKEGRNEGRKEGRKQRRNENEEIPPLFYNETRSFFSKILVYIFVILLPYICFDVNSTTVPYLGLFLVVLSTLPCLALST